VIQEAGTMVLEVLETAGGKQQVVAANPDAETIARVVQGLSWSDITFVVLKKDENNYLEGSGSFNPNDGLSATYMEDGVEHVSRYSPKSLQVIVALLTSYRSGDGKWRTMIEWD
jgi:hypothetical protein